MNPDRRAEGAGALAGGGELELAPGSFDVIVGSDLVYYWPDVRPLAYTITKLLAPGGACQKQP